MEPWLTLGIVVFSILIASTVLPYYFFFLIKIELIYNVMLIYALQQSNSDIYIYIYSRVLLFVTLWTVACQTPLSMGFSRQEYWSGLPFLSSGDLPNPGIELVSLRSPALAIRFFTTSTTWEVGEM